MSAAAAFDLSKLLDEALAGRISPSGGVLAEGVYGEREGLQFRTTHGKSQLVQEVVRLTDRALLLASDFSPSGESLHQQVVNDSDWVHIQFRLNGGGCERVSKTRVIETPPQSCVVTRYPQGSVIDRTTHATDSFRVACLLLNPQAVTKLLDVTASRLPERAHWIAQDDQLELQAKVLPLSSKMRLAVNDILSCSFRGPTRRAYMRAKSLELLSSVIHVLESSTEQQIHAEFLLAPEDMTKIAHARHIMMRECESLMTLAALARRVGVSRTKLALGFKEVYGLSVQAYWRDERLDRARELLQREDAKVTDVALSVGYSEISSFTRAFKNKFGLLPRALKRCKK